MIRVFDMRGKLLHTLYGHDVIRALCKVSSNHPSGAQIASASNDGVIRLWTLNGRELGQLQGHDSFIYSLASLPTGELISSGEDRTVRIWQGNACVQTITHPAISVWCVAACAANGDIVSGASDRIARVFTRDSNRHASAEVVQAFEESVKSSSIPQQQVGEINKEKLPGPEFLQQKSGSKEGQVVMIREENGNVTAHQWSMASQQWISVGTVVDAVGSSGRKREYLGQDYDYVFDVDIKEGEPPLKLPYNLSQNPYEAATKFLQDNELPMTYLDQVAEFITTNTRGATIGQTQQSQAPGPDPLGTESRYRPGDVGAGGQPPAAQTTAPKKFPQKTYLSITQANLKVIQKKIEDLNQDLIKQSQKELALNPSDISTLQSLISSIENKSTSKPATAVISNGLNLVVRLITTWPQGQRLPALDLLRLLAAETIAPATYRTAKGESIVGVLERSGVFSDQERTNNIMLAVRTFANLFETAEGRALAESEFDAVCYFIKIPLFLPEPLVHFNLQILLSLANDYLNLGLQINTLTSFVSTQPPSNTTRNLQISYTTLLINYSVLFTTPDHTSAGRALELLEPLSAILEAATDSEVIYRALVAAGTLVSMGVDEVKTAATDVFGLVDKARAAKAKVAEPRIKEAVAEIEDILKRRSY